MRPLSLSSVYKEARAALEIVDIIFNLKEAHSMKYSIPKVRKILLSILKSLSPADIARSPGRDFSRIRKCSRFDTLLTIITMAGHSLRTELDNYFLPGRKSPPSISAFVQQRAKLSSDALYLVFSRFNERLPFKKTFKGLHLLACDGSDLNIPPWPGDTDTYIPYNSNNGGYFQMHLNALFDLLEKRYLDAEISPRRKMGENAALCRMADRNVLNGKILYIADRGYNCFNTFAHIINAGQFSLIRAKNIFSRNSFLKDIPFPASEEFDIEHTFILARKIIRTDYNSISCKYLQAHQTFDYISPDDKETTFTMRLRIVKIRLGDDYEYLVTNLPPKKYSMPDLKQLYHLRWGIETSFRQLKYDLALSYFHCKKRAFIEQEVFARLVMYNYISLMTGNIPVKSNENNKHNYHVSFSDSVNLCRRHLLQLISTDKLKALLLQRRSPVRPERSFPRNIRSQRLRPLNNRA